MTKKELDLKMGKIQDETKKQKNLLQSNSPFIVTVKTFTALKLLRVCLRPMTL